MFNSINLSQLKDISYYHGEVNASEAEKILSDQKDGSFLLRDSSQKHYSFLNTPLTISFVDETSILHIRIEVYRKKNGNISFNLEDDEYYSFETITQLIDFCSHSKNYMDLLTPKCYISIHNKIPFSLAWFAQLTILSHSINTSSLPTTLRKVYNL